MKHLLPFTLILFASLTCPGQWHLIDDFQGWENGNTFPKASDIGWHATCHDGFDEYWLLADPHNPKNIGLYIEIPRYAEPSNVWAMKNLPDGGIPPGETGTICFQSLFFGPSVSWHFGTAHKPIELDPVTGQQVSPGAWEDYNALVRLNPETNILEHRDGDKYVPTDPPFSPLVNVWYVFFLVVENTWDTTVTPPISTGVYTLYIQGPGMRSPTLIPVAADPKKDSAFLRSIPSNNEGVPQSISWFMFARNQGSPLNPSSDQFLIDNIYFSHGMRISDTDPPIWWSRWSGDPFTGNIHTEQFLGWINIWHAPNVWSYSLDGWLYIEEPGWDEPGAWAYFYK